MPFHLPRPGKAQLAVVLVIAAMLFAGAGVWYFKFYTKTPEYALHQIQTAIQNHDQDTFNEYVDTECLINAAVDDILAGMMSADHAQMAASQDSMNNLAGIFRAPLRYSFHSVLEGLVRTGTWGGEAIREEGTDTQLDTGLILSKLGLRDVSFHGLDSLEKDKDNGTVNACLRIYPAIAGEEFILRAQLSETVSGRWQIKKIVNFNDLLDFIERARQAKLKAYLASTDIIINKLGTVIKETDQKRAAVMRGHSLGETSVRHALHDIVTGEVLPAWQTCLDGLEKTTVPDSAHSIHRLRQRIAKSRIEYCQLYGEWLDSKNAGTIRKANEVLNEARTMEREHEFLLRRLQASVNHG